MQYFERLAELQIFAATKTFLLGNDPQDSMASNNIDLRPFMEMHLMNEPDLATDYDEVDRCLDMLNEKKKTFVGMSNILRKIQANFKAETGDLENKNQAVRKMLNSKLLACKMKLCFLSWKVNEICLCCNCFIITNQSK